MSIVNLSLLIDFEENFNLFDVHIKNIKIWPLIRYQYMQGVLDQYNDFNTPQSKSKSLKIKELLVYMAQVIAYQPKFFKKKKSINFLFFAKGTYKYTKGKYYNRITEPYAEIFPNESLLIEESFDFKNGLPRTFKNIKLLDIYLIKAKLLGSLLGIEKQYKKEVYDFIEFLKDNSPFELPDVTWLKLQHYLCSQLERHKFITKDIAKLLNKIQPKVIFIEEACYGNRAYIVDIAKKMGIKTVEFQHGFIGNTHPAYNYGERFLKTTDNHCPEYILTYGEYWKKSITVPSQVISIGNPSLEQTVKAFSTDRKCKSSTLKVLVISSGVDYNNLIGIILDFIDDNLKKTVLEIVFRPHPLERPVMEVRYKELIDLGVKMSVVDLYDDIINCDLVFGEFSTALYEATVFNKKVIMLDNKYSRQYVSKNDALNVLEHVESAKELSKVVFNNENYNFDNITSNDIWAKDWKKNYHEFISLIKN